MAVTKNSYTGDGATTQFTFTFPYLDRDFVKVLVGGLLTTAFTFINDTTIQFTVAPADGASVVIFRETDAENLVADFNAGSAIPVEDLERDLIQNLHLSQETQTVAEEQLPDDIEAQIALASAQSNEALSTANTANATANSLSGSITTANTTANTALSTANAAVATADEALVVAEAAASGAASWPAGTAAEAGSPVSGDLDTGLYSPGANILAATAGGVERMRWDASGTTPAGPIFLQNGTAAAPSLSFASDVNTGLFRVTADQLGVVTNGVLRATFKDTAFENLVPVRLPVGSAAAPALSFTSDPNTGVYSTGADSLGFTVGGNTLLEVYPTGVKAPFVPGGATFDFFSIRAFVRFNGASGGANKTIAQSGNVTNVSDTSVGNYVVNFTNAMPDSNYLALVTCDSAIGVAKIINASSVRIRTYVSDTGNAVDDTAVSVIIIR
jgi:hypothetical protein